MKKIFKIPILLLPCMLVFALSQVFAQNATTAAGGTATGPGGSATYSIGQVFYSTGFSAGFSIRQGVQQPADCIMSASLGTNRYVLFGALGYNGCGVLSPVILGGVAPYTYIWSSDDAGANGATTATITPCNTQDVVRTYTVVVTGANGCHATATVKLTYININCSNNNNTVKVKVCHVPPGNSGNYRTICVSVNAVQTLLDNGSYLGECLPLDEIPTIVVATNNVSGNNPQPFRKPGDSEVPLTKQVFEVKVAPNPAYYFFRIQVNSSSDELISVRILDVNGRLMSANNHILRGNTITVGSELAGGAYFAEVTQGKNRKVVKLLKLN